MRASNGSAVSVAGGAACSPDHSVASSSMPWRHLSQSDEAIVACPTMPDSAFVHDATGLDEHASLIDLLDQRAEEQAGDRAYVFLSSGGEAECVLSFAALRHCVRRLGGALAAQARPGDRVLLALPTGPECVVG